MNDDKPLDPNPIYLRLLILSQGSKEEAVTITPAEAKLIVDALTAVGGLKRVLKTLGEYDK